MTLATINGGPGYLHVNDGGRGFVAVPSLKVVGKGMANSSFGGQVVPPFPACHKSDLVANKVQLSLRVSSRYTVTYCRASSCQMDSQVSSCIAYYDPPSCCSYSPLLSEI